MCLRARRSPCREEGNAAVCAGGSGGGGSGGCQQDLARRSPRCMDVAAVAGVCAGKEGGDSGLGRSHQDQACSPHRDEAVAVSGAYGHRCGGGCLGESQQGQACSPQHEDLVEDGGGGRQQDQAAGGKGNSGSSDSAFEVVRCAVRQRARTNQEQRKQTPSKPSVEVLQITRQGCGGDYNAFRQTMCTRWRNYDIGVRAVSIMTEEALGSIRSDGWPVENGDLGENLTVKGQGLEKLLRAGQNWRVGDEVLLQLTEPIKPCNQLQHLAYVGFAKRRNFSTALEGRRGWYARVLQEGRVSPGDSLALEQQQQQQC